MAPNSFVKTAEPFACGGSAATFASCVIHPMDLAKVSPKIHVSKSLSNVLEFFAVFSQINFELCRLECNSMVN